LDEAEREQLLDGLLEDREHAGVVRRDTGAQAFEEGLEAKSAEILGIELRSAQEGELLDALGFRLGREIDAGSNAGLDGGVAAGPREDEADGREHALAAEDVG